MESKVKVTPRRPSKSYELHGYGESLDIFEPKLTQILRLARALER